MIRRFTLCMLLAATVIFTIYGETTLRPYWLKNHIDTYTLADWFPNLLAPMILVLLYTLIKEVNDKAVLFRATCSFVAGLIIYEIVQLFIPSRTFDHKDIIASVVGGAIIYGVVLGVFKLFPPLPDQVSQK
ncbi:VanZ family protein [Mucilaginibacter galii]|nr:VanZ family protein [Mucilaginibacter galii]